MAGRRNRKLSVLTRSLLQTGEGEQVDFKKIPDGVSADDLVAFANSPHGGQILVGVVEENANGAQVGVVRGCDVTDGAMLQIANKAISCIPPVSIEMFIENLDAKPIIRIEVASSATKPHCTPKGVYNRRDGSRNRPLHPSELLRIFLDAEGKAFADRFEAAAERITADLSSLESSLDDSIKSMADQLGWAESQLDDSESNISAILGLVRRIDQKSNDINLRARTLFRQDNRDDPVRKRELNKYAGKLVEAIDARTDLLETVKKGGTLQIKEHSGASDELTADDANQALVVATDYIRRREDGKRYSVFCKTPGKCSDQELEQFCDTVAEGGEVVAGLKERLKEAFRLGFITYDGIVVGTAALKKPRATYRTKVFTSAKAERPAKSYPYELGWIYLKEEHRKKGQMTRLIDELLPLAGTSNLFATTRTSNTIMREMLDQLHFKQEGEEYVSALRPDETLRLYLFNSGETDEKTS